MYLDRAIVGDPDPVLVVNDWATNSDLMIEVARLGYLDDQMKILDPTYGKGGWWTKWTPAGLVAGERYKFTGDYVADLRHLPFPDATFDALTLDPPYVATGGRTTSTVPKFNDAYGIGDEREEAPKTPAELQALIWAGMVEAKRVLKAKQRKTKLREGHAGGLLLIKSMSYVSGGKMWPGTYLVQKFATETLGLEFVDQFVHRHEPGMQPERKRADGEPVLQDHARANSSVLQVYRKGWPDAAA